MQIMQKMHQNCENIILEQIHINNLNVDIICKQNILKIYLWGLGLVSSCKLAEMVVGKYLLINVFGLHD